MWDHLNSQTLLGGKQDGTATLERSLMDAEPWDERLLEKRRVIQGEDITPGISLAAKGKMSLFNGEIWRPQL